MCKNEMGFGVRRRSVHLAVLGAGMLVLAHGCNAESKRVLIISPSSLATGGASGTQTLEVRKKGAGSLPFTISVDYGSGPSGWLLLSQTSGSATSQPQYIDVTDQRDGLPPGHHTATIRFETDRGKKNIPASVDVAAVATSVSTHDFGTTPTPFTLGVWNAGAGVLNFEVVSQPSWLVVSNGTGISTGPGTAAQMVLTVNPAGLPPQTYSGSLVIGPGSGGGTNTAAVDLGFTVPTTPPPPPPAPPALTVLPAQGFTSSGPQGGPFLPVSQTYVLMNTGGSTLQWSAGTSAPWAVLSQTSGTIGATSSTSLVASIGPAANSLTPSNHVAQVSFTNLTNGAGSTFRTVVLGVTGSGNPSSGYPAIVPGPGWTGPTAEPPPVGNSNHPFFGERVIARFTAPANQDWLASDFHVGVTAYMGMQQSDLPPDVEKVEFSCQNGPWTPVTQRTLNPSTGSYEFVARLRPEDYPTDGPVEIRTRVYPKHAGKTRVLSGLIVHVGVNGTLSSPGPIWVHPSGSDSNPGTEQQPVATIRRAAELLHATGDAGGGTIYLKAATNHVLTSSSSTYIPNERWFTVRPAPGLTKASVKIASTQSNGLRAKYQRFFDVTFNLGASTVHLAASGEEAYLWTDECEIVGWGATHPGAGKVFDRGTARIMTGGSWHDNAFGPTADQGSTMVLLRGAEIFNISEDVVKQGGLVSGCFIHDVHAFGTPNHPDVFVLQSSNVIIENTVVLDCGGAQGIYPFNTISDFAVVNCVIESGLNQNDSVGYHHFVLYGTTLTNMYIFRHQNESQISGVCFRGNVMAKLASAASQLGGPTWSAGNLEAFGEYSNNQSANVGGFTPGFDWQQGDPLYVNPGTNNYSLQPSSPCLNRLVPVTPADVEQVIRTNPTSCGGYQG